MIEAYKDHGQFILLLIIMYVVGVWADPLIYLLFPLIYGMFGLKGHLIELFITTLWLLILSDYIPVKGATYADLQFAKDLKPILPIFLFGFYYLNKSIFPPIPKIFLRLIPFFIITLIGLKYAININIGAKKYVSFILMYFTIPIYVHYLHNTYGSHFWKTLFTFIIGMLIIGLVLGVVAPQIGILAGGRFKGILGNPNGLGIFLYLIFSFWMVIKEFKLIIFTPRENLIIFLVIFISVFWAGSRNTMMSIFLFYLTYRLVKIHWSIAIVTVAAVIVFQDLIFVGFVEILQFFQLGEYFRVDTIEKGSGRKIAWIFAWSEIKKDYFFIGGSFGQDEQVMRPNYYWLEREGHNGGVHNTYLSMWFDSGIIGLILYFSAFLMNIFKSTTKSYIGLAFMVSFFFNINYESWVVASLNPFTIIFLIILTIFVQQLDGFDEYQINTNTEIKAIEN